MLLYITNEITFTVIVVEYNNGEVNESWERQERYCKVKLTLVALDTQLNNRFDEAVVFMTYITVYFYVSLSSFCLC